MTGKTFSRKQGKGSRRPLQGMSNPKGSLHGSRGVLLYRGESAEVVSEDTAAIQAGLAAVRTTMTIRTGTGMMCRM